MPDKESAKLTQDPRDLSAQLKRLGGDVNALMRETRRRYASLTPEARRRLTTAVTAVGALLAAVTTVHKVRRAIRRRRARPER